MKAFADDKINVIKELKFASRKGKNMMRKGESAGLPAFSPFPTVFPKGFFHGGVKSRDCVVKVNSLPNDKNLNQSKLKAFADDRINVNQKLKFDLGRVENIAGKGRNAGYQHFLLFPQCFLGAF